MLQKTLVLLKNDAIERGVSGEIITRFEKVGLKLVAMKMTQIDADFSKKHYSDLIDKPFYPGLEDYITAGPVLAMVLEGLDSVELVRKMVGSTEPKTSAPGTIRGDYAHHNYGDCDSAGTSIKNLIHASGTPEEALVEVPLWFNDDEIYTYESCAQKHTF